MVIFISPLTEAARRGISKSGDLNINLILIIMVIKNSFKGLILAISIPVLFSSCATIFAGGSPEITIDGTANGPVTISTTKGVYQNVNLPYTVKVNRHKLDGQRIYVQSETQKYRDIVLEKSINSWTWGNILIGGLIGWAIDLGTNCVSKPAQTHFYIQPEGTQTNTIIQNTSVMDVQVP